ncbi:hypothetical protein JCGZ_15355 [Jatropha curcas]|uniref:Uncharacterized protein n=1 Tax=Jatropha curcas TaxID=180498 RepID=A0A067KGW4_JATCU|nr:hypothetical protein JCGZ_15355 [Jatropha curcas]
MPSGTILCIPPSFIGVLRGVHYSKSSSIVEKKTNTGSLDSDGGPTKVGLGSSERGCTPCKEGEINSTVQNPTETALTLNDDLNKCLGKMVSVFDDVAIDFNSPSVKSIEKVTRKKIDVMDSLVIQSATSKSSTKEDIESSSKCNKELKGKLPQSSWGSLILVVLFLKRSIERDIKKRS